MDFISGVYLISPCQLLFFFKKNSGFLNLKEKERIGVFICLKMWRAFGEKGFGVWFLLRMSYWGFHGCTVQFYENKNGASQYEQSELLGLVLDIKGSEVELCITYRERLMQIFSPMLILLNTFFQFWGRKKLSPLSFEFTDWDSLEWLNFLNIG